MMIGKIILSTLENAERLSRIVKIFRKNSRPIVSTKHLVIRSDFVSEALLSGRFEQLYHDLGKGRMYLQSNEILSHFRAVFRPHITGSAHSGHHDHSDRSIVISWIGHRVRSEATLSLVLL